MSEKPEKNPLLFLLVVINTIFIVFIMTRQMSITEKVSQMTAKETQVAVESGDSFQSPHLPKPKDNYTIVEYPFGDFQVNLARPRGPQRFIKLNITLIVETPLTKNLSEIINKSPTLRDEIISILNKKTPQDILKLEGREVLKNILKEHMNSKLKDDQIKRILFTRFTVS